MPHSVKFRFKLTSGVINNMEPTGTDFGTPGFLRWAWVKIIIFPLARVPFGVHIVDPPNHSPDSLP